MLVLEIALGIVLGVGLLFLVPAIFGVTFLAAGGLLKGLLQLTMAAFCLAVVFATVSLLYTIDVFPWYVNFVGGVIIGGMLAGTVMPPSVSDDESANPIPANPAESSNFTKIISIIAIIIIFVLDVIFVMIGRIK